MPQSFLIITKSGHAEAESLAAAMVRWFQERSFLVQHLVRPPLEALSTETLGIAAEAADVVLVLGGDGTFIGVARQLTDYFAKAPVKDPAKAAALSWAMPALLGVNFGRLGFLTEVSASAWATALEGIVSGRFQRVARMLLAWEVERAGRRALSGFAINDIVVGRGTLARVANIQIDIQEPANTGGESRITDIGCVRADGIIVASPLGSTAYTLSARGPLVHQAMSALIVTAIAPFSGCMPPIVIPGESRIGLRCLDGSAGADNWLTVDGQEGHALEPGDRVLVWGLPARLELLTENAGSYLDSLRCCGFIREFAPGASRAGEGESL